MGLDAPAMRRYPSYVPHRCAGATGPFRMPGRYEDEDYEPELTIPGTLTIEDVPRLQRPHVLEQIRGPGSPHQFVLDRDELVIGRSTTADLQVDSAELSRRHLLLKKQGAEFGCQDLESRNGVFLNGVKI